MLEFRELTLEDKPRVEACAHAYSYHLCEHCFTDLFIWRGHYHTRVCFWEGFLLVQMKTVDEQQIMYLAPVGEGDLAAAIRLLEQDAQERGVPFAMCSIAEDMKPRIEARCPAGMSIPPMKAAGIISTSVKSCRPFRERNCKQSGIW